MFLLRINYTPSPFISRWLTKNFYFKEDISRYRGELIGVPVIRMLSFIDNKDEFINIGNLNYNRPYVILMPLF